MKTTYSRSCISTNELLWKPAMKKTQFKWSHQTWRLRSASIFSLRSIAQQRFKYLLLTAQEARLKEWTSRVRNRQHTLQLVDWDWRQVKSSCRDQLTTLASVLSVLNSSRRTIWECFTHSQSNFMIRCEPLWITHWSKMSLKGKWYTIDYKC